MGLKDLVNSILGPAPRLTAREETARTYGRVMRPAFDETKDALSARRIQSTGVAIGELIELARSRIRIYGSTLPKEIFYSYPVRRAIALFLENYPDGKVVIMSDDPAFQPQAFAQFAKGAVRPEHVSRITLLPTPKTDMPLTRFVHVETDTEDACWRHAFADPNKCSIIDGIVEFCDADTTTLLRKMFDRNVARFGSPPSPGTARDIPL
ncbi:MAG: hypothetical protein JWL82_65 [Parcubacteria group bacterium]|nr:hypothetical protein [Parcubacteria group bacterium]